MGVPSLTLVASCVTPTSAWCLVPSPVSRDPEQNWCEGGYSRLCLGASYTLARPSQEGGGSRMGFKERPGKEESRLLKSACLFLHPIPKGARTAGPWPSLSIVRKNRQVPNTARQVASLPGDTSRGKRSSMPQPKTRPDSPVPSLQQ